MNLKQLETFFWVATLNSFRKTADRLCTTQPAVLSRIAALEQSLSVKLFERRAGTFSLTAKGQERHDILPAGQTGTAPPGAFGSGSAFG